MELAVLTEDERFRLRQLASSGAPSEWADAGRAADILKAVDAGVLPPQDSIDWFLRRFRGAEPQKSMERCPRCRGEITCGFGLAGGGVENEDGQNVPGVYYMCLDCDWMTPEAKKTVCVPHGLVRDEGAQ